MSCIMRRTAFRICENKGADQLHTSADQHFCFRYKDSTIPQLPKSKILSLDLAIFCNCTARFVSGVFISPE